MRRRPGGRTVSTRLYWFGTDLRLDDHPGLRRALAGTTRLLPVYCHDPRDAAMTPWGFARVGGHRQRFLAATLADLRVRLEQRGSTLVEVDGRPRDVLPVLARSVQATEVVCEAVEQAESLAEVDALRGAGIAVAAVWHSTLFDPQRLPFPLHDMPRHFTPFRQAIEQSAARAEAPLPMPEVLPPPPPVPPALSGSAGTATPQPWPGDARSSFPYHLPTHAGGETAALAHLARYFSGPLATAYRTTRNRLSGTDNSTKFSPWLAHGALSPRRVLAQLRRFEAERGASDGSYAIWFELLWRDFFRLLVLRERQRSRAAAPAAVAPPAPLPHAEGAGSAATRDAFERWRSGSTGVPLVDAGMRELAATGFLSNRLRQLAASYLIHDLGADPMAGAAWFASQLIDFDPYSNDGNWRYIAGTGADPRGGRRFNVEKQTRDHDPDGQFQVLWGAA